MVGAVLFFEKSHARCEQRYVVSLQARVPKRALPVGVCGSQGFCVSVSWARIIQSRKKEPLERQPVLPLIFVPLNGFITVP